MEGMVTKEGCLYSTETGSYVRDAASAIAGCIAKHERRDRAQ